MNQDRPGLAVAHVLQDRQQLVQVVAVDRADIIEAQLLEHRAAGDHAARELLGAQRADLQRLRQLGGKLLADLAQRAIGVAGEQPRQIARHRADRRRDRHVVVVEDDDQARVHRAGIVHRLIGHAGGHRAVADHGDDVVLAAGEVARHGHAERRRNRGRGMRGAERVVFALGALGEAGQAAAHAQRADAVAAAGENLVRIGLMADVPDDAVVAACRTRSAARRSVRPRPSPAPRWPPVTATASIVSVRSSSATCRSWLSSSLRRSAGVLIWSRRGVLDGLDT